MHRLASVLTLVAALVAAGCGGGTTPTNTTTVANRLVPNASCADVSKPEPRKPGALTAPTARLNPSTSWLLTFHTSCGTFAVLLQPATSPRATASLVALAREGYFDGTIFHRIVPSFVIQGGDPTQIGGGGPGYTTVDTPKVATRYVKGVVAMAKTATEPRGAAGSQFFVMTADAPSLDPDYAVVGRVVTGSAVVQRIGKLGDPADPNGTPTQVVVVDRVTISSK